MAILKRFGKLPSEKEMQKVRKSPHYKKGKFHNVTPTATASKPFEILKAYAKSDSNARKPKVNIPVHEKKLKDFDKIPSKSLKLIWMGHVSILLEIENLRILIDPVISKRASPVPIAGPGRFHKFPIEANEMPHIDYILISHNHYDHLDYKLIRHFINTSTKFITSLGLETTLKHWGIEERRINSLDWHQKHIIGELEIIATPTRHFSGRTPFDRDKTFWCSYVIRNKAESIYYEADSGYFKGFKEVGDRYGPFDLSLMGIGAYNDFWADIHTFPEEAVQGHIDLKAKKMIPIHWCTFNLAIHPWEEPVERAIAFSRQKNIQLIIPQVGEWVDLKSNYLQKTWWRKPSNGSE